MKKHLDGIIEMLRDPVFWALMVTIGVTSATFSFLGAQISRWLMP